MTNTKVRTLKAIYEDVINYFNDNEDIFNQAIEELDSYNGYLGDDRYYSMDELDEFYRDAEPTELLNRAFYGYDEDSWTVNERGEKEHYNSFNPNREYFTYNGYGNLVSTNYKDYSAHLDEYAIESMLDNRCYVDTIDDEPELSKLFDELEKAYEEENPIPQF